MVEITAGEGDLQTVVEVDPQTAVEADSQAVGEPDPAEADPQVAATGPHTAGEADLKIAATGLYTAAEAGDLKIVGETDSQTAVGTGIGEMVRIATAVVMAARLIM